MKIKYSIYTFLFALLFVACEDDLNIKKNIGEPTLESYYNAPESALGAVLAGYEPMQDANRIFFSDIGWGNVGTPEFLKGGSDAGDQPDLFQKENYTIDASNGATTKRYTSDYTGIYAANIVLENLASNEVIDPEFKEELLGEAYFLRAYYHADLAKLFGGVVLANGLLDAGNLEIKRATLDETYAFIFSDLDEAIARLPWTRDGSTIGRAIKGSALGIAVRAAMIYKDYDLAIAYAEQLFQGPYSLAVPFGSIWTKDGEWGSGSLFEINYEFTGKETGWALGEGGIYTTAFGPRDSDEGYSGWGFSQIKQDFLDSWPDNDPRKEPTYFTKATHPYGSGQFIEKIATAPYNTGYAEATDKTNAHDNNIRVIRLADVYLMYAEAQFEKGDEGKAKEYLTKVRDRAIASAPADWTDVIAPIDQSLSGNALRDAIRLERTYELCGEGIRYYDILRWELADELLSPMGFKVGVHEYAAIPEGEITLTEGRIEQNPGY